MSISLNANADGVSGALQIGGSDVVPFNAGGILVPQQSVAATQGSGAITATLNACVLSFRSSTLTTGVPNTRKVNSPISVVIPSGATLGTVTTVAARIVLLAIDNAGTVELAVVNLAGGNDLSETGLISTTAIDTASDSANVVYSTTARTNVPYRVVGYFDAVNTAGAWGNPTTVQGYGGQALAAMSSLGYGQAYSNPSRVFGTTYYNTTGKSRYINVVATNTVAGAYITITVTQNGAAVIITSTGTAASGYLSNLAAIIPPGAAYVAAMTGTPTLNSWQELG